MLHSVDMDFDCLIINVIQMFPFLKLLRSSNHL